MHISISVHFTVDEPGHPDKDEIAMEVIEGEARKFSATVTDRLERQGLKIDSFKFND